MCGSVIGFKNRYFYLNEFSKWLHFNQSLICDHDIGKISSVLIVSCEPWKLKQHVVRN